MNTSKYLIRGGLALAGALMVAAPLLAHHSFAGFEQDKTKVFTGVVTRVNPDANHLQIYFAPMNAERKNVERGADNSPIIWQVEMAGSAAAAGEGISVSSFPPGTVFSVGLRPLRNGETGGFRDGPLFKCPVGENGKSVPPPAGKHCDALPGSKAFGQGKLATPTP